MMINIYNHSLELVGQLMSWLSMEWVEGYNSQGSFVLSCQKTPKAEQLLQEERYCILSGESDRPMEIVSVSADSTTVTAWGVPAAFSILDQRVSTEVVKNENAETAVCRLVSSMIPWPRLSVERTTIAGNYTNQVSDGTIRSYAEAICTATDMGFRVRMESNALRFGCYKPGVNPNAVYTPKFGNMGNAKRKQTISPYKNVAVVAGAGEGNDRVTIVVGATTATGDNRREMYIDARNIQPEDGETQQSYLTRLRAYGLQKLCEAVRVSNIEFDLSPGSAELGDIVRVILPDIGMDIQARVITKTIKSQNNQITRKINVGDPIVRR